jgi:hypothetical protein
LFEEALLLVRSAAEPVWFIGRRHDGVEGERCG